MINKRLDLAAEGLSLLPPSASDMQVPILSSQKSRHAWGQASYITPTTEEEKQKMAIPKLCLLKQPDQNTDGSVYTEHKRIYTV